MHQNFMRELRDMMPCASNAVVWRNEASGFDKSTDMSARQYNLASSARNGQKLVCGAVRGAVSSCKQQQQQETHTTRAFGTPRVKGSPPHATTTPPPPPPLQHPSPKQQQFPIVGATKAGQMNNSRLWGPTGEAT